MTVDLPSAAPASNRVAGPGEIPREGPVRLVLHTACDDDHTPVVGADTCRPVESTLAPETAARAGTVTIGAREKEST